MPKFSDLWVALGLKDDKFKKGLDTSKKQLNKFSDNVKKVGAVIASVFAIDKLIQFGTQSVKLGGQIEGVKKAFENLDSPGLLRELRRATRGTVTDLELMTKAVQAKNFKIPLEQLATYFEFATKRAIQTGESVDYLVDSIITGIGRKSVLVMDNLGISAVELQKEIAKVGDFGIASGNIIQRELSSMGDVADTTATSIAQLATAWSDLKLAAGDFLINSGIKEFFEFKCMFRIIGSYFFKVSNDFILSSNIDISFLSCWVVV